jgi:hypothetical protein
MIPGYHARDRGPRPSVRGGPRTELGLVIIRLLILSAFLVTFSATYAAEISPTVTPVPSIDPGQYSHPYPDIKDWVPRARSKEAEPPPQVFPYAPSLINFFDSFNFDDNATYNGGYLFIPPDPIGASGPNHVVSIGNCIIEWRTKLGGPPARQALQAFFNAQTFMFDPKVIYDQHAGRFVAIALEETDVQSGGAADVSRIYVAVSQTNDPTAGWYFLVINSAMTFYNPNLGVTANHWADYPGLAVDDGAIYITNNMFSFPTASYGRVFGDSRLWIIRKGLGTGGFYDGGPAAWNAYDPSGPGYPSEIFTIQPSHVFGPNPGSDSMFLVAAGWSNDFSNPVGDGSGVEFLSVTRVDNPLVAPTFSHQFVNVGNIENAWNNMPDAQQASCPVVFPNECNPPNIAVETNDRRSLHCVWRNNRLYVTAQIVPEVGPDAFQSTAHWWDVNTTTLAALAVNDQGDVGAEDLGPQTYTYFPSIAVDSAGNLAIGFAASNEQLYPGAFYTGRLATDPPGTVQPTGTLALGQDCYRRYFSGTRNRWGDYTGLSVDPTDDATFWVFNEYAIERGTPTGTPAGCDEYGRWGTRWGSFKLQTGAPDLTVTVFTGPCCAYLNEPVGSQIFCRIKNIGTANATTPFAVALYASADAAITPADPPLINGTVMVPSLNMGQEITVPFPASAAIPPGAPLGNVYLGVIVDDSNVIAETNELNNTAAAAIAIGSDVFYCTSADVTYAADPLRVSVFTSPAGNGRPLNNAQYWDGVIGNPPINMNAAITAMLTDNTGGPVVGQNLFLYTTLGGLVPCVNGNRSDTPTNGSGITTWTGPIYGGGYTDPVNGELTAIRSGGGPLAAVYYGLKQLFGSDTAGTIYMVDHNIGAAAPICPIPPSATEIEYNPLTGLGFVQESNGAFMGQEFNIFNCAPVAPPLFNGWAFNGLEWVGPKLYGAGVPNTCSPSTLLVLDPLTGATILIGPTGLPRNVSGMAWDATCYTMYAVTGCKQLGTSDLVTIDLNTGLATIVGNTQLNLGSLEFGPDGRLYAGDDVGQLWVINTSNAAATFVGPTGMPGAVTGLALVSAPGMDIQFNSSDINGDLVVNLVDVGAFAGAYVGGYAYFADFYWDGILNLSDVARLAATFGEICPVIPAKPSTDVAVGGEIGIFFDVAGTERTLALDPGVEAEAHVLLRGPAATRGISAWESRVATSSNVEILGWSLEASSLNVAQAPSFIVGTGNVRRANDGAPLELATVRFRVTDAQPAHFFLHPVETPSVPSSSAVVSGDELFAVGVAGGATDLPVAYVNDQPRDGVPLFAGVNLRAIPNPFNPSTKIHFDLPRAGRVDVEIYDVGGRLVRSLEGGRLDAGAHEVAWNGKDQNGAAIGSGVYFIRLFLDGHVVGDPVKTSLLK